MAKKSHWKQKKNPNKSSFLNWYDESSLDCENLWWKWKSPKYILGICEHDNKIRIKIIKMANRFVNERKGELQLNLMS